MQGRKFPAIPSYALSYSVQVIGGNDELRTSVSAAIISSVFNLIQEGGVHSSYLVAFLEKLVRDGHSPVVVRNQSLVVKAFVQHRFSLTRSMVLESTSLEGRREVFADPATLKFHLAVISLLASCAQGSDSFIESVCTGVLRLNAILNVMIDADIDVQCKKPYMRFLLNVYLRTSFIFEEQIKTSLHRFLDDMVLWDCLALVCRQCLTEPIVEYFDLITDAFFPLLANVVITFYSSCCSNASVKHNVDHVFTPLTDKFVKQVLPSLLGSKQV